MPSSIKVRRRRRACLILLMSAAVCVVVYLMIPEMEDIELMRALPADVHVYSIVNKSSLILLAEQHIARPLNDTTYLKKDGKLSNKNSSVKITIPSESLLDNPLGNGSKKDDSRRENVYLHPSTAKAIPEISLTDKSSSTAQNLSRSNISDLPHYHNNSVLNLENVSCDLLDRNSFQTKFFCLKYNTNLTQSLFRPSKYGLCYIHGAAQVSENLPCKCTRGWYGQYCSTPELVEVSNYPYEFGVSIRKQPARVIYAFPFLHEFDMLEARLDELDDLVDVFIVVESNYTAYGNAKPKFLLDKLSKGYLQKYHHKIFHVSIDYFPKEAHENGWVIEELARHMMTLRGVSALKNLEKDDIFIVTDADELPVWDTIFFLKFHTGYPEPIGFNLRHNVFGFFWQGSDNNTHVFGACSIAMLENVFINNAYHLRSATRSMREDVARTDNYKYKFGGRVREWSFGQPSQPAGWHCSWCLRPKGIQYKLIAAHASDLPRWGNYPEKTKISYIEKLIKNGGWFDDKTTNIAVNDAQSKMYAPKYFLRHPNVAPHLLGRPA